MAILIPDKPDFSGDGGQAEEYLVKALVSSLSGDFFIYHGLKFLDEEAFEGEADVLVLHRELGILIIECKGNGVRRAGSGQWIRSYRGAERELKKDPFDQARETLHTLVNSLQQRAFHRFGCGGFPMPFGYAVAFPLARRSEANLPVNIAEPILFDSSDMAQIGEKVKGAMGYWAKAHERVGAVKLNPVEFASFRKKILHPKFQIAEGLGCVAEAEGGALLRLTREQSWVSSAILENRRFRVRGGAGTGKTILAMDVASRLAAEGLRVLVLCYNKALAAHISKGVSSWGLESGRARGANFHRLCEEAWADRMGVGPTPPESAKEAEHFWNIELPCELDRAIESGISPRWDAIVVDEGQDFLSHWWPVVESLLENRDTGRLFIFYDPAQTMFGRPCAVPESFPVLKLTRALRSTRALAEALAVLGDGSTAPHPMCPDGEIPQVKETGTLEATREEIERLVKRLTASEGFAPEQISILTPHKPGHSSLADIKEIGGKKVSHDPIGRAGAILHTTFGAFKGLESDVVILADVDPADPRCDRPSRYSAASRACSRLFVFHRGDWLAP